MPTEKIKFERKLRQGDLIFQKFFTFALENVFKSFNCIKKSIDIDHVHLNHLRFADDIILISRDPAKLQNMQNELNPEK